MSLAMKMMRAPEQSFIAFKLKSNHSAHSIFSVRKRAAMANGWSLLVGARIPALDAILPRPWRDGGLGYDGRAPGCTSVLRSKPVNLNRVMPAEEELASPSVCPVAA